MSRRAGQPLSCVRLVGRTTRFLAAADPRGNVLSRLRHWLRPRPGSFLWPDCRYWTGITLAIELNRASRRLDHYSLPWEGLFSAIRGFGYGAGLHRILGFRYAIAFGILVTVGQVFAYSHGMRPAIDHEAARRPRLSRRQFWGTVVRTLGFMATALICSFFIHHVDRAWWFAIRVGLLIGIVTGVGATVNPYIEYYGRQPSGAAAWGIRHRTHPLRFCFAVLSVLAAAI